MADFSLDVLRALPKVLLHDHLDGGLRPTTVLELADECGWTPKLPTTDAGELQAWFTAGAEAHDLLQYLATFEHTLGVMQTEAAIERVAYEAVIDLAADGVVYAEVRFAPELHQDGGLSLDAVIEAVGTGFRRGERDALTNGRAITVNAICCAMRTDDRSVEIAETAARMRYREPKLVAFDLAGAETGFPPSLHAEALAIARRELLNITIHASEPPDRELIADALAHGAHRIGHGVRLATDILFTPNGQAIFGAIARYVFDHGIALEMAPTCHVQIGAVPTLADHPFAKLLRLGFNVTLNTDNRLMSNVSPTSELAAVTSIFDLSVEEMRQIVVNGIQAAFCPAEHKHRLLTTVIHPAYDRLGA
jgi:adenosine deaminase